VYTHTHTHTHIYIYIHKKHTHTHTHTHIYIYVYIHKNTHTHTQNTRLVFHSHSHALVTIKFSWRHTAHCRTATAQHRTQNNCLHSMLYTGTVILCLQHRQTLNCIYFLSQMDSHFTPCLYICFGSLSCILSRRNWSNQAAFVQQFLPNKTLSQPFSHPTFFRNRFLRAWQ
jgi:hypothetical protein